MHQITFLDDNGTFSLRNPENWNYLYFPLAGLEGLKSAVTPNLGGDAKLDQEGFLLEPVSSENLHNNRSTRNFWVNGWSVTGASAEAECQRFTSEQEESLLTAGLMRHSIRRISEKHQLEAEVTSFIPLQDNVEIMHVTVRNTAPVWQVISPVAAVPIYGRSADNIRDHRNVTSLLHRIRTTASGVLVKPTMSFDEKGHRTNDRTYYVLGVTGSGEAPVGFWPTVDAFLGEGGSFTRPGAVFRGEPWVAAGSTAAGREAMGGIRFADVQLEPGAAAEFTVLLGITGEEGNLEELLRRYATSEKVRHALEQTGDYWNKKVNVRYRTGEPGFDGFLRWVSFQPFLRRLFGCSFLPHHDYGRGGRGWRDLWQDCLSLLLMDPGDVRSMIVSNFGGVRIDGTNATIIGHAPGEFIADRNGISRVWMDHGFWPWLTTRMYIDQTGDLDVLLEKVPYFKDPLADRGTSVDESWTPAYGSRQRTRAGDVYEGTVLEHILLENLGAYLEVGSHDIIRLRGADWNDALDMAWENGESVAFTFAYAGNLLQLAQTVRKLKHAYVELLEEIKPLLEGGRRSPGGKQEDLNRFLASCRHSVSGRKITLSTEILAQTLEALGLSLMERLRVQEWLPEGWFNSYYDNSCRAVEGTFESGVRMMLTGQVFAIMSGTATDAQVESICRNADRYLYRREIGGYRLNTDFHEEKFDMGRMFGFAYGEKENGAVFSHMTVMYANALYRRGFVREGWKALKSLADTAMDFSTSRIYPGIPEYFDNSGRGMYHYLTGSASWYMMTVITQVFGVRGEWGDLRICPQLTAEQFDGEGSAEICLTFAGKEFAVRFENPGRLDFDEYTVTEAVCDGRAISIREGAVLLPLDQIRTLPGQKHRITVILGKLPA